MSLAVTTHDEIQAKYEKTRLEVLLDEIARGQLRLPWFQRPFAWQPEQIIELFGSLEKGYPIGSFMIWDSPRVIPSLDRIADLPAPTPSAGRSQSYLVDGHQRLAALYGCLMSRPARSGKGEWVWNVHRVLGDPDGWFRQWRSSAQAPPTWLPMRSVLRTPDFHTWTRRLNESVNHQGLIDEAEFVAQRIKSCEVPVLRLTGGPAEGAAEVFARLRTTDWR